MVVGAGLILGPILGGFLTSFGWTSVFWFNVPIGIIGAAAAFLILVEQAQPQRNVSLDLAGSSLYLVALLALMTSLAFGGIYGWTTWWVIGGFVLFLVVMPFFCGSSPAFAPRSWTSRSSATASSRWATSPAC